MDPMYMASAFLFCRAAYAQDDMLMVIGYIYFGQLGMNMRHCLIFNLMVVMLMFAIFFAYRHALRTSKNLLASYLMPQTRALPPATANEQAPPYLFHYMLFGFFRYFLLLQTFI
jgi:hypothetical protein